MGIYEAGLHVTLVQFQSGPVVNSQGAIDPGMLAAARREALLNLCKSLLDCVGMALADRSNLVFDFGFLQGGS
ncbi:hypothetical protein D3C71_1983770 [compost metagenome]